MPDELAEARVQSSAELARASLHVALGEHPHDLEADRRGEWTRLKICPADDCQWAFYDRSRNRSATWCDMKVCGNRHKVREYRERRLKSS